jgi:hypothetical protein
MVEKVTLKIFWIMMLLCASTALILIWFNNALPGKLVPTFFIVGFASFLIWSPLVVYRFLRK